ncbi:MAG: hypothetical protein U1F57_02455 [bacterium]
MSFSYDRDELGYEPGYSRPVQSEGKPRISVREYPDIPLLEYYCQVPAASATPAATPAPTPAGSTGGGLPVTPLPPAGSAGAAGSAGPAGSGGAAGSAPPPPGASTAAHLGITPPRPAAADAPLYTAGPNETRLRETLRSRGLQDSEIDAFMSRFPVAREGNQAQINARERAIRDYLPPNSGPDRRDEAHRVETNSADYLRGDITQQLKNQACDNYRANNVTPQQAWDNLYARGMIDATQSPRPADGTTWAQVHNGRDWSVRPLSGGAARATAQDPIFTRSPGPVNAESVRLDTQRRNYIAAARDQYTTWAMSPTASGGLGLTREQAEARFNQRATELGLMTRRADGSYEVSNSWNPNNSPQADSFFHREGGVQYDAQGRVVTEGANAATFRHENLTTDDSATNPVTRVARQSAQKDLSRDALYASLTGQVPEGSPMRIETSDGHTFLVNPTATPPTRQEIRVMQPPLTRNQALAYMESNGLTDADGRPLPNTSADAFTTQVQGIQSGSIGNSQIQYRLADWERQQIAGTLSGPPYNMTPQQITRYMQSKGWLGDNPNTDQMEAFRRRARTAAASGGSDVETIRGEVRAADIPANEPVTLTERDRAADIRDTLTGGPRGGNAQGVADARAGREAAGREGAAGRDTQIRVAEIQTASSERVARENREENRAEQARQRDFQAEQNRMQREHDSAERRKDRDQQALMALLQFIGQMISTAVQAMGQVTAASIQSSNQLSGQIIGGMRSGGR